MRTYEELPTLAMDRPADGVLRIVLDGPDPHAVGAGDRAFSAGGSFDLVESMIDDWQVRTRVGPRMMR